MNRPKLLEIQLTGKCAYCETREDGKCMIILIVIYIYEKELKTKKRHRRIGFRSDICSVL